MRRLTAGADRTRRAKSPS